MLLRHHTIDLENPFYAGDGITAHPRAHIINKVGAWVRATRGPPSWNFFMHIHHRNEEDFKLSNSLIPSRKHSLMANDSETDFPHLQNQDHTQHEKKENCKSSLIPIVLCTPNCFN